LSAENGAYCVKLVGRVSRRRNPTSRRLGGTSGYALRANPTYAMHLRNISYKVQRVKFADDLRPTLLVQPKQQALVAGVSGEIHLVRW